MNIETVPIDRLVFDPANARTHDEKNIQAIKSSLARFEQVEPLVVQKGTNIVIGGNGRLEAMKALGYTEVEVNYLDIDNTQAGALGIVLNRTSSLADWNKDVLGAHLEGLQADGWDLEELGFHVDDLEEFTDLPDGGPVEGEDDVPEVKENIHGVVRGNIWQLGSHRLMCGDSTDSGDVESLMAGEKADMVFTDPPYGVSYQSNMRVKSKKFDVIENYDEINTDWLPLCLDYSTGFVFVWTTWKVLYRWMEKVVPLMPMTNMVIWNKGGGGLGDLNKTLLTDYEIALVSNRNNDISGKRIGSVWDIGRDNANDYKHPTQKPVALAEMAITHCSKGSVLDLFLGSGSTLIACEKTNRKCFGMEISEHYTSVIIERWQNFTNKRAILKS